MTLTRPSVRPRLLAISFACSPYRGSEAGAGWNRVVEAAKYCDTWVICEEKEFAADIERYTRENGAIQGLRFVYVRRVLWQWVCDLKILGYLAYNLWHRRALKRARALHAQVKFDLTFQTSMCGYREPGYSWQLGIPFVWGPVGGTQNFPWRFLTTIGIRAAVGEAFRSLANRLQLHASLRVRRAARTASAILAANSTNARDFANVFGVSPVLISDVGTRRVSSEPRRPNTAGPLRLLWSGVLEHRKALPVLLEALSRLKGQVDFHLVVLGTGPCRKRWRNHAQRLGLHDHVSWLGHVPHAEALEQYRLADAFAFTSLRDTTGMVVVEALAEGLPVIAFDHQGVGDVVNDTCGLKIPVETPARAIRDWELAIRRLAADPALRDDLSRGARRRAADYLWSIGGRQTAEIFYRAIGLGGLAAVNDQRQDGDAQTWTVELGFESAVHPAVPAVPSSR